MVRSIIQRVDQASLCQAELKGAEFARKKLDDVDSLGRRHQNAVNPMDDTVGSKLCMLENPFESGLRKTYNVDCNDSAIEIDSQAPETNIGAQSLHFAGEILANQSCRDSMRYQNTAGWVELWRDMVQENLLDLLFGWLMTMDPLEGFVNWSKDSIVCRSPVQECDKVVILIDELCKLGRVLAFRNQLIDCHIWLVVVAFMAMMFVISMMTMPAINAVGLTF